jgi:hypothetical protein
MSKIEKSVEDRLRTGVVIPAMPLALNSKRKLDERRQRALIRYYRDQEDWQLLSILPSLPSGNLKLDYMNHYLLLPRKSLTGLKRNRGKN